MGGGGGVKPRDERQNREKKPVDPEVALAI